MSRVNTRVLATGLTKVNNLDVFLTNLENGIQGALQLDINGNLWVRSAPTSSGGPAIAAEPDQSAHATSLPAAATQATATLPAGTGLQQNVAKTLSASINAVAAQGVQTLVLRDGATGVGPILWQQRVGPVLAGDSKNYEWVVQIPGTNGAAMTLEFTAAPAATNFNSAAITGYLQSNL